MNDIVKDLEEKAELGDIFAQHKLADYYFEKNTPDKAVKWLERCANYVFQKSYDFFDSYPYGEAEQLKINAQQQLVDCYLKGSGVEKNPTKAVEWLKEITNINSLKNHFLDGGVFFSPATYLLAIYYCVGKGVKQNYDEAINIFKTLTYPNIHDVPEDEYIESINPLIAAGLAICYYRCDKEKKITSQLFECAVKKYNPIAILWSIFIKYNNLDIDKEINELKEECRINHIIYISICIEPALLSDESTVIKNLRKKNIELKKNKKEIADALKKAAQNLFEPRYEIYTDDFDIVSYHFPKEVIVFLEKRNNCCYANIILAYYYQCFNETEKVLEHLKIASEKGDILANRELGIYYEEKKEFNKAIEYFKKINKLYSSYDTDITEKINDFAKNQIKLIEYKYQLEKKNEQLEEKIKQNESLQNRMQKLVEQFTHSLGNVIFPDTIYQVAERLKNLPECRRDTLLLHEAYHAEIIIKLQAELLRHRYGNKEPESFRNMIRKCRRNANADEKSKTIEDILNFAVSRVTARFLNQHYAGLETIRNKILTQTHTDLNQLKQKFEDDILLHNCLSPLEWVSQNLRPIQITQISPLWKKVFILSDSYAEALLFGYFSEILFNAFKYADHENQEFLTLSFAEETINDDIYLSCNWSNPTTNQKLSGLGTNQGLEAIAEDLKQLNSTEKPEQSLLIYQQENQFKVSLFFKKELLVETTKARVPESLWG